MNGSALQEIPIAALRAFKIALPPTRSEQECVAETLTDADVLVESVEQLLAKKCDIKQGAMQELLTGKKRLPGFTGQWRTRQIGDVIESCSSGATPYRGRLDYYEGAVKWITSGELNYNIIVGAPATTNQSCMAIYPSTELRTDFLYHYYVLRGNDLALRYCQGTKQQSYTGKLVKLPPIDLPPTVDEQAAVASVLSDMDSEVAALESKLTKARQIKQGMMQELLTGRIRLAIDAERLDQLDLVHPT